MRWGIGKNDGFALSLIQQSEYHHIRILVNVGIEPSPVFACNNVGMCARTSLVRAACLVVEGLECREV